MDCDVAIIGAGFAGCATAWWLNRRGVRTIVLERERMLGKYASGRAAGLGRQIVDDDDTTALTVRGAQLIRAHAPHAWREVGSVLGFDDAGEQKAYVARAKKFDIAVEPVDGATVTALWPGLKASGGLRVPSDGVINVHALLDELARPLSIRLGVRVDRVEPGKVITAGGELTCRVVVDASGAWAGTLTDGAFQSFKRHVFVLAAEPPQGPFFWHLGKGEVYARGEGQALMVSACDETAEPPGDSQVTDEAGMRAILTPLLKDARIVNAWACQRTFAPDRKMQLGKDPKRPWLAWAAGLGGHGATAALAVGERVADAVLT